MKHQRVLLCGLFTVLLGALVWWPTLSGGLVADDYMIMRHIQSGGVFGLWSSPGQGWFRPLVSVSFWIDWNLWGSNAWGWHFDNLLLHLANSWLVGLSLVQWLRLFPMVGGKLHHLMAGILTTMIFAIIPVHGESVAWISDRTDILSVFFALLSWNAYLYARIKDKIPWTAWIFFAFALCSKEAVLTLPGAVLLVEWAKQGRPRLSKQWLRFVPWLVMGILYIPIRAHFVGALVGGYGASAHFGVSPIRLALQPFLSIGRMLMPDPMPILGLLHVTNLTMWRWSLYGVYFCAGASLVLYAIWRIRGKNILPHVLWLGACIAWMLPSLSLGFQVDCSLSVRFLYFASAALVPWIVIQLEAIGAHRLYMRIAIVLFFTIWCASSWETGSRWKHAGVMADSVVSTIAKNPSDYQNVLLVGVPDHLKGALVFRSGLDQALKAHGVSGLDSIKIPAAITFWSSQDFMISKRQGDTLLISSSNPLGRWVVTPDTSSCWDIVEEQRVLRIRQDTTCPVARIMHVAL